MTYDCTRSNARPARSRASAGNSIVCEIARASSPGSAGGTRRISSPSERISGIPPDARRHEGNSSERTLDHDEPERLSPDRRNNENAGRAEEVPNLGHGKMADKATTIGYPGLYGDAPQSTEIGADPWPATTSWGIGSWPARRPTASINTSAPFSGERRPRKAIRRRTRLAPVDRGELRIAVGGGVDRPLEHRDDASRHLDGATHVLAHP